MSERSDRISDELQPYVDETEADRLDRIAERLIDERAAPSAAFRAELRATLESEAERAPRAAAPPPQPLARLRVTVAAYACGGLLLLAVAALGLAGAGPLAP